MKVLHANSALLPGGWHEDVRLFIEGGRIHRVETGPPQAGDERHAVLVPAMANLHSHAFQRAMAGLTETRGAGDDSFWSWRSLMYRFALSMTPDQVQAIAAQLYMEMLEAGFAHVGEFHYLHHGPDGSAYGDIAEMAARIGAASVEAGIGLTLLPVFYAHSGFGGAEPADAQRRFIHGLEDFGRTFERCQTIAAGLDGAQVGVAPHSLRAVTPAELAEVAALCPKGPIHIHIAEQTREVEDCMAWSGARPVEWLLDNAPVGSRWCLIHATHMTQAEAQAMARSGAIAGLCPITESNLGDGIFAAPGFLAEGGRLGVGSDSNVQISLSGELRQLEYSQRLGLRARNVIALPGGSNGRRMFDLALEGGAAALGIGAGLAAGRPADIVALDTSACPHLAGDQLLDHWIFTDARLVDSVWSRGIRRVTGGRHHDRETITRRFGPVMQALHAL